MYGKCFGYALAIAIFFSPAAAHALSGTRADASPAVDSSAVPNRSAVVIDRIEANYPAGYVHDKYVYFDDACGQNLRNRTTVDYSGPANRNDRASRIEDRRMCSYMFENEITTD